MRRLLFALVTLLSAVAARAAPLVLTIETQHASLEGRLAHFADASAALPFEAVRAQEFALLPAFRSLGYDTATHWFHFEVDRAPEAPRRWILAVGRAYLEELDVWVGTPQSGFVHHALSKNLDDDNPQASTLFTLPVDIEGPTAFYIRARTKSAIVVTAELWRPVPFAEDQSRTQRYLGMHFGILLIAAMLYGILALWLRDTIMATYAGYIVAMMLMTHGDLFTLLSPTFPWIDAVLSRLGWLWGAVFITLMWIRLLDLKGNFPRVRRLYQFSVLLFLSMLPVVLMPSLVTDGVLAVVKLANTFHSLNFLLSIGVAFLLWRRSRRTELLLYGIAFLVPALGSLTYMAANRGWVDQNLLTSNLNHLIAPLIHVLVMSVGLALRLRQIQHDKAAAEQAAALTTQRAEEQRRFVAMLSHEFRNPLAAIDRSAQMIQLKTPALAEGEVNRLIQIRGNVATLAGFVDNFLMTEALDHGALALAREPCTIRPLLEGAVRMQGEAGRRVRLSVVPDDAVFDLDPTLAGVAVGNLLGNALRYSPPETAVEVTATVSGDGLRMVVADRGPGLSDEEMKKLGRPYFRASSSLGKKGSGLGYHFTQRIVEAHGGSLTARARGDGLPGLEVEIRLPVRAQKS